MLLLQYLVSFLLLFKEFLLDLVFLFLGSFDLFEKELMVHLLPLLLDLFLQHLDVHHALPLLMNIHQQHLALEGSYPVLVLVDLFVGLLEGLLLHLGLVGFLLQLDSAAFLLIDLETLETGGIFLLP